MRPSASLRFSERPTMSYGRRKVLMEKSPLYVREPYPIYITTMTQFKPSYARSACGSDP